MTADCAVLDVAPRARGEVDVDVDRLRAIGAPDRDELAECGPPPALRRIEHRLEAVELVDRGGVERGPRGRGRVRLAVSAFDSMSHRRRVYPPRERRAPGTVVIVMTRRREIRSDVLLIGSGIMSATLGMILEEIDPDLSIHVVERLPTLASESTDGWNNAGTGHAALCELNYTPARPDRSIDVTKALRIDEQFEQTKQFWAYLVEKGRLAHPRTFVTSVPHMSFVRGDEDVDYLRRRHRLLVEHHLFRGMEWSDDPATIGRWAPLLVDGRTGNEPIAATRSCLGTDVDFGELARWLFADLVRVGGVTVRLEHEVRDIERTEDGSFRVAIHDLRRDENYDHIAGFVFIGAGGAALPLLAKSDIPEAAGYGGFPVSGQWLRCTNPEVIARHQAKVYGKASTGAPPMSVPHLDARTIKGEPSLLFGPFAGFSTKFLKHGSYLDLPGSLEHDNVLPMLKAGWDNLDLTKYLIDQLRLTPEERIDELRRFVPTARSTDWELIVAGQRVQIIKKDATHGGVLEFGTEIVSSADGALAALLGASPGASTAVSIMFDLVTRCLARRLDPERVRDRLVAMVPSYGRSLEADAVLTDTVRRRSHRILGLDDPDRG